MSKEQLIKRIKNYLDEASNEMGDDDAFDDETWQGQANNLLAESLRALTEK